MALLNGKFYNYFYRKAILDVSIRVADLNELQIIDLGNLECELKKKIIQLSKRITSLYREYCIDNLIPQEKTALQRQIEATDKQIDQLVYKLYGLTEEEIKIVEESAG